MNERPPGDDVVTWHRTFAAEANDRAWTLSERRDLTTDERVELLDAAHAAAYHWRQIGSEAQIAQADLLLGWVHALLGHGRLAMRFATMAFDHVSGWRTVGGRVRARDRGERGCRVGRRGAPRAALRGGEGAG